LKAQCGGKVLLDTSASAHVASNNFNIVTNYSNELIVISYDGWNGPGKGPVTVDGNPATHIATAWDGNNSGTSEIYAYTAPTSGKHTILCIESNYFSGYYLNFAAAFYASTHASLSISDITAIKTDSIRCLTGGSIKDTIYTTKNNSMIYCDAMINTGSNQSYPISWIGATFLDSMFIHNGSNASAAYSSASTPGKYVVTAKNLAPSNNGCGGITMAMVVISPPTGAPAISLYSTPDTGYCSGTATATVTGGVPPYTYRWSGGQTTASISGLCAGSYCCKVYDLGGCSDSTCISVIKRCPMYSSSICYVTADTNSKHNIIVWQKGDLDSTIVDSFIVYRGVASNIYAKIGEVSIHNYSEYIDSSSSPDVTSYFYKLGIVDTCHGVPISAYHQSILLQSSLGIGHKINLNWNFYQGTTVNYYRIMRDDSGKGKWHVLDSVPGGVNAYTDTAAPLNMGLRYRLGLNWNVNCSPYIPHILPHSPARLSFLPPHDKAYSNISITHVA